MTNKHKRYTILRHFIAFETEKKLPISALELKKAINYIDIPLEEVQEIIDEMMRYAILGKVITLGKDDAYQFISI